MDAHTQAEVQQDTRNMPKDPFARISTFGTIKKLQTGKSGRELVIVDFALAGKQFNEIDDLASKQTEIMLTIQPSRRGTIWAGHNVEYRLTLDDVQREQDAFSHLVVEISNAMRSRMLDKFALGWTGWDSEDNLEEFKSNIHKCIEQEDWIDAINNIMLVRNLEKPVYQESQAAEEEDSQEDAPSLQFPEDSVADTDFDQEPGEC